MPLLPERKEFKEFPYGCVCFELEQAREAVRERKEYQLRKLEKYNMINARLEVVTFDSYQPNSREQQLALHASKEYVESFDLQSSSNLLFSGMYGLGKSHLAYSICKGVRSKGHSAVFVSMPKLLTMIKDTYNNENSEFTEAGLINVLSAVNLLVIDDIGAQKGNKTEGETWATEKLFEIVDGRAGRHTVYTTNLTSGELRKNVGERIFSRMIQDTKSIKFVGEDYRLKDLGF
jgi:DNA replication protein DnaC